MNYATNSNEEENINIQKYFFLFIKNWFWFTTAIIIAFVIVFLVNRYSSPVYEAKNTVIITEKEAAMGAMGTIMKEFGSLSGKSQNIENYIGILQSYTLVKQTLERLDYRVSYFHKGRVNNVEIFNRSPIRIELDTSHMQVEYENMYISILSETEYLLDIPRDSNAVTKKLLFNQKYESENYAFSVSKTDAFDIESIKETYIVRVNNYNRLTKQYLKELQVEASFRKGTIIDLTSRGTVPEKVVDFLNTLIYVAIENDLEEKNLTSYKTLEFIDNQLMNIVDSLNYAEQNLETFRSDNKIIDLSIEGSGLFKKIEDLQAKKSILDIRIKYYEYILETIQKNSNVQDVITPSVIGVQDPTLNSLINQLSALYAEKQIVEYSATGDNPGLKLINIRIRTTIDAIIDNVQNLITSAKIEAKEIAKEIELVDNDIKKLPKTEREFINIQRRFELNNNIYNFLLQKSAEVGITKAANMPDLKFIDMAYIENVEKKSPKNSLNYIIGLFLACLLPGGFFILRDLLNNRIIEREEIEQKSSIPILGSVAHNKYEDEFIPVRKYLKSSITESFRTIRTNLSFFLPADKKTTIITFTSTVSGEGKTYCAINLASIIAMNNKRVLLVGLDLRKPKLHTMLNQNSPIGISNYLVNRNTIDEIIVKTEDPNFDVIFSGPPPPNPLELIESEKFEEFVDKVKSLDYDMIVFDTPPIGLVADGLSVAKYADLNIFVIRQNYTHKNTLKFINDIYSENKVNDLCLLINDVKMINNYGYRYGGTYGHGQKEGYYDDEIEVEKNILKRFINIALNRH